MSYTNEAVIGYGMSADKFFQITGISYQDIDDEYYVFVPYDGAEDDEVMVGYLLSNVEGVGWDYVSLPHLEAALGAVKTKCSVEFHSYAHMFIGCGRL